MSKFNRTFEQKLRKKITLLMITIIVLTGFIGYSIMTFFQYRTIDETLKNQNMHLISKINDIEQTLSHQIIPEKYDDSIALFKQFYVLRKQLEMPSLQQFIYQDTKLLFTTSSYIDGMDESYINLLKSRIEEKQVSYLSYSKDREYVLVGLLNNNLVTIYQMLMDDFVRAVSDPSDVFLFVNANNEIIIHSQPHFYLHQKYDEKISHKYLFGKHSFFGIIQKIHLNFSVVSYKMILHNFLWIDVIYVMAIVIFFVMIAISIYSKNMVNKTAHSLNLLMEGSKQIKSGNMAFRFDLKTNDEFEILGKEINEMLNQIQNLNENAIALINANKQSQMKQLTAQFHPHFLYNMLETIRYMIVLDQNQASQMIVQLTKVLRYSIDSERTLVTLEEDMNYLQIYLQLHQIRFNDRLKYELYMEDSCSKFLVSKLCIQPLIENSIVHNFKNVNKLFISIKIRQSLGILYIDVEDDGMGMDPKWLSYYQNWSPIEQASNHLGIENVLRRLYLTYFGRFTYKIDSNDKGTKIQLMIKMEDYV